MLIKPSQPNIPFTPLYPRDVVWQAMKLIIGRCYMFMYNGDNIVFAWISYMLCFKMGDGILTSL